MRLIRVGWLFLGLGVAVGVLASVALLVGFEPARLPPALLNIAAYKLTFLAALMLLAVGAVFLRHAQRVHAAPADEGTPRRPPSVTAGWPAETPSDEVRQQRAPGHRGDPPGGRGAAGR